MEKEKGRGGRAPCGEPPIYGRYAASGRGLASWAKRGRTVAADRRRRQPPEIRREARESHHPSKLRASRTTEHGKGERERGKGAVPPDLRPLRGLRSGASVQTRRSDAPHTFEPRVVVNQKRCILPMGTSPPAEPEGEVAERERGRWGRRGAVPEPRPLTPPQAKTATRSAASAAAPKRPTPDRTSRDSSESGIGPSKTARRGRRRRVGGTRGR